MISVENLTKRFGRKTVVDGLTFQARPGVVTGFLGPNGAGKSTTMRLIVGLAEPDAGTALVEGKPYRDLADPCGTVGALLDAGWVRPNLTARTHLRWLAALTRTPPGRADELLEAVGLAEVAGRRVGGFSLGMRQRLGIATALLGSPRVLLLDEPMNGLDPEGIHWIRRFLRQAAADGRTVLVSSHLLAEMALTADEVVVIGAGRLIAQAPTRTFVEEATRSRVIVRAPEARRLAALLTGAGFDVREEPPGTLAVTGANTARVGALAAQHDVELHELRTDHGSLEDAFMEMTRKATEYRAAPPSGGQLTEQPAEPLGPGR
ncbi:ATP-binding cassette domain-containing protein [Actinomadura chibensis]|uniref:ATP-binding cassette domain-containing protein n=2 Tax=Actinomadura chibensis TaxID=392828 RepID=A0A5D0NTW7_9ACTN|nr:ATP-binding cassette domain-containing protein [Actinomadura chibensis]TYB47769.1 ATP-binding cassette domain-containing protein [Actinomadura chibensis]